MNRRALLLTVGLLGAVARGADQAADVVLFHQWPFAGTTLKLESPAALREAPHALWQDRTFPFHRSEDRRWRALIPVPMDQPPGISTVTVRRELGYAGKTIDVSISFDVRVSSLALETIRFQPEKAKLLNDPAESRESKEIRARLAEFTGDEKQRWNGLFLPPIPGRVLSPFGVPREKIGQAVPDVHRGIDLAGRRGEPVRAPNGARVAMVADYKIHGKTVLLSHGQGVGSIYIHLDSIAVEEGDTVKQGQAIGAVGASGLATGPHLHWGMYVHGTPIDPAQWLVEPF